MSDDPSLWQMFAGRFLGVGSGTFIALVFIPPKTIREFASRASVSIVGGAIATQPVREYLGWTADTEHIVAAAALSSFISWWGLGMLVRVMKAKNDLSKP